MDTVHGSPSYEYRSNECPTPQLVAGLVGRAVHYQGARSPEDALTGMCPSLNGDDSSTSGVDFQVSVGVNGYTLEEYLSGILTNGSPMPHAAPHVGPGVWESDPEVSSDGSTTCWLYARAVPGRYDSGTAANVEGYFEARVSWTDPPTPTATCQAIEQVFIAVVQLAEG